MGEQYSTLELILDASEKEFLEKGYESASLRKIAQRAGVTTGALYGYFKNKQDLFGALVDKEYYYLLELYDKILNNFNHLPVNEQFEHMQEYVGKGMKLMVEYIYDNWNAFKLILCCSKGTKYCSLIEKMAERNIRATDDFNKSSIDVGVTLNSVNSTLKRMLTYSLFSNFFEMVKEDLPKEQTEQYIYQLLQFYIAGWEKLWGC